MSHNNDVRIITGDVEIDIHSKGSQGRGSSDNNRGNSGGGSTKGHGQGKPAYYDDRGLAHKQDGSVDGRSLRRKTENQ